MKRFLTLLLCLALSASLAACGAAPAPTEAPPAPTAAPSAPEATEAPQEDGAPKVDESLTQEQTLNLLLYSDEDCAFTVTEAEFNEHLGLRVHVRCENFSDRPLMFTWNNTSVCGFMYDPFWAEEVAAGKKVNSIIDFDTYALEQLGVASPDAITFTLTVVDSEEFLDEPLVNEGFCIYPTGKEPGQVVYPEYQHKNGEAVITENDTLTFIIENVEDEVSEYYTLNCYVANHTGKNLLITWDAVSVNGFMVDPFWAASVAGGMQLVTQISFLRSDLEAQGIEEVQNIEFTILAMDNDDWDADYLLSETCTYNP